MIVLQNTRRTAAGIISLLLIVCLLSSCGKKNIEEDDGLVFSKGYYDGGGYNPEEDNIDGGNKSNNQNNKAVQNENLSIGASSEYRENIPDEFENAEDDNFADGREKTQAQILPVTPLTNGEAAADDKNKLIQAEKVGIPESVIVNGKSDNNAALSYCGNIVGSKIISQFFIDVWYTSGGSAKAEKSYVYQGDNALITIKADEGYRLSYLTVNGAKQNVGNFSQYTVANVQEDARVEVGFTKAYVPKPELTYSVKTGDCSFITPLLFFFLSANIIIFNIFTVKRKKEKANKNE